MGQDVVNTHQIIEKLKQSNNILSSFHELFHDSLKSKLGFMKGINKP